MARFCTQCGGGNDDHARFCEHCGKPVKTASTAPAGVAAPVAQAAPAGAAKRGLLLGGAVAALALAGGLAWWLAPEPASEASFARAIDAHYSKQEAARERILCTGNLPYDSDPIRVNAFNRSTKHYMDLLAQAGVYEAAQEESSGGYFRTTRFVYALSAEGRKWVRNKRLCVGTGLQATQVRGFDRIEEIQGKTFAMASAQLQVTGEAPWLAKAANREALLQEMNKQSLSASLPLARIDGKWAVSDLDPSALRQVALSGDGAHAAEGGGLFGKLKGLFSFGASHPLIGKWQDESGLVTLEFTADAYRQNGVSVKAKFETRGDEVTVMPEAAGGVGLVLKMQDHDTALIDMGLMAFTLRRVQ